MLVSHKGPRANSSVSSLFSPADTKSQTICARYLKHESTFTLFVNL